MGIFGISLYFISEKDKYVEVSFNSLKGEEYFIWIWDSVMNLADFGIKRLFIELNVFLRSFIFWI